MFGYLQIQKSELLVREYEAYKAVYCGLCKQMGKDYSFLARLSLSYDCTFYAMLLMSLSRSCSGFDKGRCEFNPLKRCSYAHCENESYSKAAALSMISVYYKLIDDLEDSKFFKRLFVRMIKPFFSHWRKKAAERFPETESKVAEMMQAQREVEHGGSKSLDAAAHPTAQMLADVLAEEGKNDAEIRILREFGYQVGRWIYLIDAADDYEDDNKSGCFNPFLNIETDDMKTAVNNTLNQCLARAYDAFQLLDIIDFKGIFNNMLLYGFPSKQNSVIFGQQEVKNDRSI